MTITAEGLEQFERSYCDCFKCKAACKTMPGVLAPEDVLTISEHVLGDPDQVYGEEWGRWFFSHFVASNGTTVMSQGKVLSIPTIVPAQKEDGSCVFLTDDVQCGIHSVAPFGCRNFNVCDPPETQPEATNKSAHMLSVIMGHAGYKSLHESLESLGQIAPPLEERRENLYNLIELLESKDKD